MILKAIDTNIRKIREQRGLTQAQAALEAELRQSTVSEIELGKRAHVSIPLLERLTKAIGTTLKEIMP